MRIAIAAVLVLGCKTSDPPSQPPPQPGSASGVREAPQLHPLASYGSATLVVGSRRIALLTGDDWLVPAAGAPRTDPEIGAAIAKTRIALGGDFELYLGAQPIAVGGEEHRESFVRLASTPMTVAVKGSLARVATVHGSLDVWQLEDRLRSQLVVVGPGGMASPLPALVRGGPDVPGLSPIAAKACEAPHVKDLAASGDGVFALVTECNLDAPLRIVGYRWAGATSRPSVDVAQLASPSELGFEPTQLVVARDGTRALVGAAHGALVIGRLARDGKVTSSASLTPVTLVANAAVADDGSVWTLTLGADPAGHDVWQIARDGVVARVIDRAGTPLRPSQLAFDERYGIVVLATNADRVWLLIERAGMLAAP